jgi:hypothetical protein
LVDDCELKLLQGANEVAVPNDLFLDFQFISYLLPAGHVRLHSLAVSGPGAFFRFMYNNLAEDNPIIFEVPIVGIGGLAIPYHATLWTNNTRLQLWLGEAANTWLPTLSGTYSTPVAPAPLMFMQPALSTFQDKHRVNALIGDTGDSVEIDGDIYVQSGYNVEATVNLDSRMIQFFGMPGAGLGRSPNRVDPDRPGCDDVLLSINGVYADRNGEFRLKGAKGVIIKPVPAAHEVQIGVAMTQAGVRCRKFQQRNQP